ncbi:MAG: hypothetical protein A3K04_02315 [Gallionellales bacterium RBG_16_56_9]|nr:MAG: hypothetical protein A3K04_02315 [Gallionellales bacterium RBG_16_56_9]
MIENMTVNDIHKALGVVFIILGRELPPDQAHRLAAEIHHCAQLMEDNDDEPTPGTIAKGFARALLAAHPESPVP